MPLLRKLKYFSKLSVKIFEFQTGRILYSSVAEGISSAETKEESLRGTCKSAFQPLVKKSSSTIKSYGLNVFDFTKPAVEPIKVDRVVKEEYEKGEIDWTNLLIRKNPKGKPSSLRKGLRLLMRGGTYLR